MNNTGENLFYFTEHSHVAAEQTGYSDYSYWRSVIQTFLKKKGAVFMWSCLWRLWCSLT